jgi:hypothetical protein
MGEKSKLLLVQGFSRIGRSPMTDPAKPERALKLKDDEL